MIQGNQTGILESTNRKQKAVCDDIYNARLLFWTGLILHDMFRAWSHLSHLGYCGQGYTSKAANLELTCRKFVGVHAPLSHGEADMFWITAKQQKNKTTHETGKGAALFTLRELYWMKRQTLISVYRGTQEMKYFPPISKMKLYEGCGSKIENGLHWQVRHFHSLWVLNHFL